MSRVCVALVPLDVCDFRPVLTRDWHMTSGYGSQVLQKAEQFDSRFANR